MAQNQNPIPDIPCQFTMSVRHKYFELIKSGAKDIELRAYDEKRKKVKTGDKFLLFDAENPDQSIIYEILNMHVALGFFWVVFRVVFARNGGFLGQTRLLSKFCTKSLTCAVFRVIMCRVIRA